MSHEIFTVCSCGKDHYNELLSFGEAVVCGSGFFHETADIQFYKSLLYDKYFPVLHLELVRPLSSRLSVRFHMEDIQAILWELRYSEARREELYRLIYDEDDVVAYQALWVCSHFLVSGQAWLQEKQNELIEEVLVCPHAGRTAYIITTS